MRHGLLAIVGATLATGLIAGGCTGAESTDGDTDRAGGTTDAALGPDYGGTLTYAIAAESSGGWCLPEAQLVMPGVQVARAVYDQLAAPDDNGDIVPFLAESITPNDTYDVWTITLREGIEFHDGTPLDAEVVKNNLDAYRGAYPNRTSLLFRFVLDNIESVQALDERTVEVRAATPWVAFPWYLWNDGRMGIVAQSQLDDPDTCDAELVGTGPFVAGDWQVNESFTMTRNDNYWLSDDAGNRLPFLDGVEFRPVIEGSTRVNMLEADEVDVIHTATAADIEILEEVGGIDVEVVSDGNGVSYFQLNSGDGAIFSNQNARLAAAYAINREQIRAVIGLDTTEPAEGPFAPGEMGYLKDTGYPDYDPERARELVQQVEAELGRPFEVTIMTVPGGEGSVDQVQEMFEDVGIQVNRQTFEATAFIEQALAGSYDLMTVANHAAGDPDLQAIWWKSTSPVNLGKINDPDLDALLQDGRVSTDPVERNSIYQDVSRLFGERVYNLWQSYVRWAVASRSNVHGLWDSPLPDGNPPTANLSAGHSLAATWIEAGS
ncbi:MAG: ABC transporter substrate-binding protein [Microthrixaceae bacterium]